MARLRTRFTDTFGLRHPIVSAPMALAGGGALAAAVSTAGGLGLIGGGYGDAGWLNEQTRLVGDTKVGIGFITWALDRRPGLLTSMLARAPVAVMLSFGDPQPHASAIHDAGARLICQCQCLDHVSTAINAGADVIVAQGSEAGGHGAARGTLSLVPEVADFLSREAPETLLLAAGGIADGRGLAAALMLGADGVLVGTRLWAAREALVHPDHHAAIVASAGDDTLRTSVVDIARGLDWPEDFTARVMRNAFTRTWHGNEAELARNAKTVGPAYAAGFTAGDTETTGVWFGEAAGLIRAIEPAADIVESMAEQAARLMADASDAVSS